MIVGDTVVYEVTYPASPTRVWRSLTDAAELAAWLMPVHGDVSSVGARFTMACDPIGEVAAEVLEVDPPRRLSWRWVGAFGTTTVTFTLQPDGTGTRLRLEHDGWDRTNVASRDQFESGWDHKLHAELAGVLDRDATRTSRAPRWPSAPR